MLWPAGAALVAGMWFDPSTGKFYGKPGELEQALREASPVFRKAFSHPEQLTHEETKQVQLELISRLSGLLNDATLKRLARKESDLTSGIGGEQHEGAAHEVVEGELALRELGFREQSPPEMALLNPQTGQILTASDAEALLKEFRAKRAQRAKQAKAKRAKEAKAKGAKPAKTKRAKPAKSKRKRKSP